MTSTNDGKDVKSIQTSGQKGKTYYIELYKSLEAALGGECKLSERTRHLCEAWRRVYTLCLHSLPATQAHLLAWLQRHTSRTVLQTEWQSPTSKDEHKELDRAIKDFISECQNGSERPVDSPPWQTQLVQRGLWFQRILSNPWGHPVLKRLLDSQVEPPCDLEVLEWLKEERGVMFLTRLRQLAASKCTDLALTLASAVMDRVRADTDLVPDAEQVDDNKDKPKSTRTTPTFAEILKTEAGFTVDVWELLVDIEFVLLHKGDKRSRCIQLAKQTPLRNGYQLVERLNSRLDTSPKEKKLWKNAKEVATLIAQVVVARCMVVRVCGGGVRSALYCCTRALARLVAPRRLAVAAGELAAPAATARHLHTLAAAVHAELKGSKEMIPFMCELYVRAITAGMNELERLKLKTEMEPEARAAEQTLASWFTQLGALLSSSDRIQCECTLTAFSVHPSPAMYDKIKAAPTLPPVALDHLEPKEEETNSEFGSWASDSRSQTNFVKTSETLNLKQTLHQANVLSTAILTEGEGIGLGQVLCQDIAVLLSGPRLKTLSWDMDRELLLENCRSYMERTNGGTRAVTTELKYLNLDPKAFQHLPEEEDDENDMFYGIEKGYEHLVEFQEPEEIWEDTLLHQEIIDSPYASSLESEITTTRRKKKSKKVIESSDDDSDPLSIMAEAKKKETKKVRPHSKERSKERRKKPTGEAPESRDGSQDNRKEGAKSKEKIKKEKKERKKKDTRPPQPRSLAHLVGMKVTNLGDKNKYMQASITDSDYDSQGKSSLNSLNSEGNDDVVFDGLYSMDELKSPESATQNDKMGLMKNNEVSITDGVVAVNKPTVKFNQFDIDNNAMSTYNLGSGMTSALDTSSQPYLTTVREEVKKSISRLIEFRRNKNSMRPVVSAVSTTSTSFHTNASTSNCRMPNAIVRPQSPSPAQICPKIVTIPDIPKMYINKKQSEQISLLKTEVDKYLHKNNNLNAQPVAYLEPKQDNEKNKIINVSSVAAAYDPVAEIIRRQSKHITYSLPPSRPASVASDNIKSSNQEHHVSTIRHVQNPVNTTEQGKQKNFQEFLKELHKTINAGAGVNTAVRVAPVQNSHPRKEIKPMLRPPPIVPVNTKIDGKITPSAKPQTQPKRLDNSLNTFSRLSYMHKNKQTDQKLQQVVNALIEIQDQNLKKLPTPAGCDRVIPEQKPARFKYPQSRNETIPIKSIPVTKCNNLTMNINNKAEKPITVLNQTANSCPVITQILKSSPVPTSIPIEIKNEPQKIIRPTLPTQVKPEVKSTSLSEKDQNDLVLLLRQQNKLNASYSQGSLNTIPNRGVAPSTVIHSGISTNKFNNNMILTPSTKDVQVSKPIQEISKPKKASLLTGVKVQHSAVAPVKPSPLKSNTSRSHSKTDLQEQNNTKKTEAKTDNKLNNKSDTPNNKITKTATDWESVMDAILAQKTPTRGPKALDVALNKSSFAKAFSDSLREREKVLKSNSVSDLTGNKVTDIKRNLQLKESASPTSGGNKNNNALNDSEPKKSYARKSSTESKQNSKNKQKSTPDTSKKQNSVDIAKKPTPQEPQRKLSVDEMQKQFICPLPKNDDPFISGIANSDYDLLEELMDDDLRQEIGELSSDEENYNQLAPNVSKRKNNTSEKRVAEPCTKQNNTVPIPATSPMDLCVHHVSREPKTTIAKFPITKCNNTTPNMYGAPIQTDSAFVNTKKHVPTQPDGPVANHFSSKIKITNNLPTNIVIPPRHDGAITADNVIPTLNPSNVFIAAVPQQRFQKVVLLDTKLAYDTFPAMQVAANLNINHLNQNTYNLAKTPNVAVYQTTQLPTPSTNQVVTQSDVITTMSANTNVVALTTTGTTANAINSAPHLYNSNEFVDAQNDVIYSQPDQKDSCAIDIQPRNDNKLENRINLDFNSNKSSDEAHVQEMHKEYESKKSETSLNSKSSLEHSSNEEEDHVRLEKKRISIINRKLSHRCDNEPIPLSFAPLNPPAINSEWQTLNGSNNTLSSKEILPKINKELEIISNTTTLIPETNRTKESDSVARAETDLISDERQSDKPACRNISSSNKLEEEILTKQNTRKTNRRKTKVRLKNNVYSDKETNSSGKEPVKARPKKRASKKANNSAKTEENKEKIKKKRVSKKQKDANKESKQNVVNSMGLDFLDIENEYLADKMPKIFDSEETTLPDASVIDKIVHYQGDTALLDIASSEDTVQIERKTTAPELFDDLTQFSCDTVSFENLIKEKVLLTTGYQKENTASMIPVLTSTDVETVLEKETLSLDSELSSKLKENLAMNANTLPNKETSAVNQNDNDKYQQNPIVSTDTGVKPKSTTNIELNDDVPFFKQIISEIEQLKNNKQKIIAEDVSTPSVQNNSISKVIEENTSTINNDNCTILQNEGRLKGSSDNTTSQTLKINTGKDIPQSYKDSIKIEAIPGGSNDPLKKCLRIRLPNGRTFKATVHGKVLLNFDDLFEEPALKTLLLSSLTDKKCYTLNIKQVSTACSENPTKIVETRIQEINIEPKTTPSLVETINLLSDDEDDDADIDQYFKTEFGRYKISPLCKTTFASHQRRFDQKCHVSLIKMDVSKFNKDLNVQRGRASLRNKIGTPASEPSNVIRHVPTDNLIPIMPVSDDEIIEIDDSSNDSIVELQSTETECHHVLQNNKDLEKNADDPLKNFNKNCFVKLVKCDDLVKKYELEKALTQKCFVDLVRSDAIADIIRASQLNKNPGTNDTQSDLPPISTVLQFSSTDCGSETSGRNSPVMEVYDSIARLYNKDNEKVTPLPAQTEQREERDTYLCESVWQETKRILFSQRVAINKYQTLRNGYEHLEFVRSGLNEIITTVVNKTYSPPDLKSLTLKYFQNNLALNDKSNFTSCYPWKRTSYLLKRKIQSLSIVVSNKIQKISDGSGHWEKNNSIAVENCFDNDDVSSIDKSVPHEVTTDNKSDTKEITFLDNGSNVESEVEPEIFEKIIEQNNCDNKTCDIRENKAFDVDQLKEKNEISTVDSDLVPESLQADLDKTESNNNNPADYCTNETNDDEFQSNRELKDITINDDSQDDMKLEKIDNHHEETILANSGHLEINKPTEEVNSLAAQQSSINNDHSQTEDFESYQTLASIDKEYVEILIPVTDIYDVNELSSDKNVLDEHCIQSCDAKSEVIDETSLKGQDITENNESLLLCNESLEINIHAEDLNTSNMQLSPNHSTIKTIEVSNLINTPTEEVNSLAAQQSSIDIDHSQPEDFESYQTLTGIDKEYVEILIPVTDIYDVNELSSDKKVLDVHNIQSCDSKSEDIDETSLKGQDGTEHDESLLPYNKSLEINVPAEDLNTLNMQLSPNHVTTETIEVSNTREDIPNESNSENSIFHVNIEQSEENIGYPDDNNDSETRVEDTKTEKKDADIEKEIEVSHESENEISPSNSPEVTQKDISNENEINPELLINDTDNLFDQNHIAFKESLRIEEKAGIKTNTLNNDITKHFVMHEGSPKDCVVTFDDEIIDDDVGVKSVEKDDTYPEKSTFLSNPKQITEDIDCADYTGISPPILSPYETVKTLDIDSETSQSEEINTERSAETGFANEVEYFDDTTFSLNKPQNTYKSKYASNFSERKSKRIVKRKTETANYKFKEKRYRKSKEIDHPKLHNSELIDTTYSREYKRLFNYCSSVQFSYSLPFHKECIDVGQLLQNWPKSNNIAAENQQDNDPDQRLFLDLEKIENPDRPKTQTLAEELIHKDEQIISNSNEAKDSNFNMGFGEGSGRVIPNLEGGEDVSKISAATLSDVKQNQPVLLSEYNLYYFSLHNNIISKDNTKTDQINGINRYYASLQLKNQVKNFFQKTANELSLLNYYGENKKECKDFNDTIDFPFGLNRSEFIDPLPFETTVQVVQVGQLPVSAAAQNPVTCDPRVTQVSDASPPQSSAESSPHDGHHTTIKTEYTELTTADITLPMVHDDYDHHHEHKVPIECQESSNIPVINEHIPIETEIKSVVKIELMEECPDEKMEQHEMSEHTECEMPHHDVIMDNAVDYSFDTHDTNPPDVAQNIEMMYNGTERASHESDDYIPMVQQNGMPEKVDQIAHAMNAAGISTTADEDSYSMLSQKINQEDPAPNEAYSKVPINTMTLQQALAQILPNALNQTNGTENNQQVLHIVQGKNATTNQLLVENAQPSVINASNATPVLHIVQNKNPTANASSTVSPAAQTNAFSGLSLVDAGLQQGGNQLLHIVNTGNPKNNAGQLLKRVNLLTNLANVQGGSEQKMVQFVCKSADGKAIQLNASHQRSMVLRLQPVETPTIQTNPAKQPENQEMSPTHSANKDAQEIKSRSVYEENYAKFIQNASTKHAPSASPEKSTSLPKFNQAFGKQIYQDDKQHDMNGDTHLQQVNTDGENPECQSQENALNLDHMGQIPSPPLLMRKPTLPTTQATPNIVQQIKESIGPMNIQTMHGGVIYTRQIPVNIGGGQTINLITVPSTEMHDESGQKQQTEVKFVNQSGIEPSIIKIVPQAQPTTNGETSQENNSHMGVSGENNHTPQPQPVLTQMRIKLPMLSKAPQMVSGTRVIRPSFFHIQRNVIGGANQQVYQQLVLTAAPQIGQQTIRLPQPQNTRPHKVPTENQSTSESQMSSSTLEQLREFDLVLEQVKERSTVQPNGNNGNSSTGVFNQIPTPSTDTTDSSVNVTSTTTETSQQVLYSVGNTQPLNMSYVSRKTTITTPTTSTYVRSPDSSGIVEPTTSATSSASSTSATSPTSCTSSTSPISSTSTLSQASTSHTVTSEARSSDPPPQPQPQPQPQTQSQPHPHPKKHKSKSRPKASSNPPNTLKLNPTPPKTSNQKPLEDEQTTQRILYILAEYKEQVENSPDKDKPAPRRRNNLPTPSGSSKRKKSRRHGPRDMSPIHGDETCRTMGSEDSSCGTSLGDCNESCIDSHSPQDSPRKVVRKLTFEHECIPTPPRPQPQRNVIVADGQTITVARGTAGKPTTAAVLMPTNYLLPLVKGGQQIAIVTNRGPKLLTVTGEGGTTNALLLQRLIGPAGLKPVLARPGFRHVRLPAAALHNLQAFNFTPAAPVQPPDSTASPAPTPAPPDLVDTRATSSPWTDRASQEVKPERGSSPEGSEPWNLHAPMDPHDYSYEETVRTENMDRTVLVVHKREGTQRQHRLTHVSAAALRHKYAILEHELRLQKSLSEECEDLGVDSPSASELFPEAELLFTASPAHDHAQEQGTHSHTPQSTVTCVPQPDIDDQIATDHLIPRGDLSEREDLNIGLEDVGIVTVSEDGTATIALDQEEFARSHPNTTFHSEPTEDGEVQQPFTITGLKGRHITSTIFHANRAPGTVLVTAPQTTVISQATAEPAPATNIVKYADIENMIDSLPGGHNNNVNIPSVLVKDDGLSSRFDNLLAETRQIRISNATSAIVHSTGNATQVIRRVCYDDDKRPKDGRYVIDEPDVMNAVDDAKLIAEENARDIALGSVATDVEDDRSSPERHTELFWDATAASVRAERRRRLDYSSDSDKCCKSPPTFDEANSMDSNGVGVHNLRLDSVIKVVERTGKADGTIENEHPPLRTYPPKRLYAGTDAELERSLLGRGDGAGGAGRRRASVRGVVKRGCHCCSGSPAPPRPKKPRPKKPNMDFTTN